MKKRQKELEALLIERKKKQEEAAARRMESLGDKVEEGKGEERGEGEESSDSSVATE